MGGKFLPRLNTSRKPIEHKYREGNVKSTLKRELKVFETAMVKQRDLLVHMVCYAGTSVSADCLNCGLRVCSCFSADIHVLCVTFHEYVRLLVCVFISAW
jgi:hypothetical protein